MGLEPADNARRYWFPAKRYGYGWGFPRVWEGWVVLLAYAFTLILASGLFSRDVAFLTVLGATVGLMVVTVARGEPARWRWGNKRE